MNHATRPSLVVVLLSLLQVLVALGETPMLGPSPAWAQPTHDGLPAELHPGKAMDLLRGEQALRNGNADAAWQTFDQLWQDGFRDLRVIRGMGEALLELRRYDELLELAESEGQHPVWGPRILLLAGEAHARMNAPDEAISLWQRAFHETPAATRPVFLKEILDLELSHGMVSERLELLREARELAGDPRAYAREFAAAYERAGEYTHAMTEYLTLLRNSAGDRFVVEEGLRRVFLEEPALREQAIAELRSFAREHPDRVDVREVTTLIFLEGSDCREAIEEAILREETKSSQGAFLISFADEAQRFRCPEAAVRAYREIKKRYPESPLIPAVELGMARQLDLQGDLNEAADAYRRFTRERPRDGRAPEAMARAGDLLLRIPGRGEEALQLFHQLQLDYPGSREGREAVFGTTEAYLVLDRREEALTVLQGMVTEDAPPDIAERAHFEKGRIFFLGGEFDSAEAELNRVVNEFPLGDTVNDCLDILLLLSRRQEAEADLEHIARGELLALQGRAGEAEHELVLVAEASPRASLWEEAELRLATHLQVEGKPDEAVIRLERVIEDSDDDVFRARALKQTGDLAYLDLGDPVRARESYERLLVEYPQSYLADSVRRSLQKLRGSVP